MQARNFLLPLCFAATIGVSAQVATDTTDIFFGHVDLGEATVTGVTGRTRLKNSSVPVQVINTNELRHTASTNIVDAIAHQPGVSQISTGNGISKPIIRGLGFNRIVCIADGVRQEGQQWGDEHGLELDGGGINSVEIIKGPASLMYGSDAMAGVVIFHANRILPENTMGGYAEAEFQTNSGLWRYSLGHSGNKRGFVWDARWSQQAAHAYKNKRDGYVPGTAHRSHAARALLGLDKTWGHSLLTLSLYELTPSIAEGERDEISGTLEAPQNWHKKSYGHTLPFQRVRHFKAVSDNSFNIGNSTLSAIIGYQQNRRREYEEHADEYELGLLQHTVTFDLRYLMPLTNGWKLAGGFASMLQHSANKGEEYLIPDYHLHDIGLFLTASRSLGAIDFNGGLRYDRRWIDSKGFMEDEELRFEPFKRHFNGLTGSIGAVWHVRHGLNLRLNLARGFRAPTLPELAANGMHEGAVRYEVGNNKLHAEHSLQADFGADYTDRLLSAQIAFFANRIDNYIYTQRTGGEANGHPIYRYAAGDARLIGFEAGLDIHPIHSLHFQNTFSYVNAVQLHQTADTKYLPLTPAPHWRSELKWEITHNQSKNGLALTNTYACLTLDSYLRQTHYLRIDGTETPTPSYTLLSLSLGADLLMRGRKTAELFLSINNLFDRAYQPHLSRLKYTDEPGICHPGRNVTLKIIVPF